MRLGKLVINFPIVLIAVFLLTLRTVAAEVQELQLDSKASLLHWTGRKLAGSHSGIVGIKSGRISLVEGKVAGGEFLIDMRTIKNKDLSSESLRRKLVAHLNSDDFFSVARFPEAKFTLKKVVPVKSTQDDSDYIVEGQLAIKEITSSLSFPAKIKISEGSYAAEAKLTFDRTIFDIRYNSGRFFGLAALGDKLIYDDVEIELKLVMREK